MKRFPFVLLLAIAILLPASYSLAAQRSVPSQYPTIQAAINAAVNGDVVLVSAATYNENINFLGKAITVQSASGAASTIIDGGGTGNVVTFSTSETASSILDGFTVRNGGTAANTFTGGIYCNGASPTITNCIIRDNAATGYPSFGIRLQSSSATISNSTITNNTGQYGGGISSSSSTLTINNSTISNNSAWAGAGIYGSASSLNLTGSTLTGNLATEYDFFNAKGGAIFFDSGANLTIENCTISDNEALADGGAIESNNDTLVVSGSTINGNTAGSGIETLDGGGGGGISFIGNSLTISDSEIRGNLSTRYGAGIYSSSNELIVTDSLVTENTADFYSTPGWGFYSEVSGSATVSGSTFSINSGGLYIGSVPYISGATANVNSSTFTSNNGMGLSFSGDTLNVSKSIFTNNNGTGLWVYATGAAILTNCLIAQNTDPGRAGGIGGEANPLEIINCTISDNIAKTYIGAGGIYLSNSLSPLVITNSILTGNKLILTVNGQTYNNRQLYPETYYSNIDINYTHINQNLSSEGYGAYYPGIGNLYTAVYFVSNANGDYHLSPNSYSIDTGTSSGAPVDDLDGTSRPQREVFDMGAYEFTCLPDVDGDGYYPSAGCGNSPDCDDTNPSIHPGKAENCSDGIDNDCDGEIDGTDENCAMSCTDYINDPELDSSPYACQTFKSGICYDGTRTCNDANGSWGDCIQDNQPAVEVCDGLDNDCDGRFDEGLGTNACDTGLLGECAAGIESCTNGDWVCQGINIALTETCDGLDNDCDGTIDNDLSLGCVTGLPGICNAGTITCEEGGTGTWGECVPTNEPGTVVEVCDGQDNNCDGVIDEGFDSDGDGTADCVDGCPTDPNKAAPGLCGCGAPDTDSDNDGTADCVDYCPVDPDKIYPGTCGCGVADCPELPLIDPDGTALSWFGSSVAISDDGTTAVVGATGALSEPYGYYGNEYTSGRVLIFHWNGSIWTLQQKLDHYQPYNGYQFGSAVSISGDGSTILVGANRESSTWGNTIRTGSAHVYVWDGATWVLQADLKASDGAHLDDFGVSTALSHDGNTAVVGAPGAEEGTDASGKGAAYVFARNGTTWTAQERLRSTGTNNVGEAFGQSVGLSDDGNTLIVGANKGVMHPEDGIAYHGLAYIFTRSSEVWTQQGVLRASDYAYDEKFGISVSLSEDGNTALVGEPGRYALGSAYLFTRSEATWSEHQKITPSDNFSDSFGISVSLSGDADKAIIGARTARTNGDVATGAAYIFANNGTLWVEQQKHFNEYGAAGDYYGTAVAISGDGYTALAGASLDEAGGHLDQGAVYVIPTAIAETNIVPGAMDVAVDTGITITFDQPMDGDTINDTTLTLTFDEPAEGAVVNNELVRTASVNEAAMPLAASVPVAGSVSYDTETMTATFTPSSALARGTKYTVALVGAEYADGTAMVPYIWSFTTIDTILSGDIDNDGGVDLADAILALKILSNVSFSEVFIEADTNNDGRIGLEEAIHALQYTSGLRTPPDNSFMSIRRTGIGEINGVQP